MDKREQILARLVEIAETIDGVTVRRNPLRVDDEELPAISIFDADEEPDPDDTGKGRPFLSPFRVTMTPEIFVRVLAKSEDVGTSLNALRAALVKAVLTDASLAVIVGTNGLVRYAGCSPSLGYGREMDGQMAVAFSITYPVRPEHL